ncbi:MAG: DUF1287 domain-containing protein [Alphaproteobacteria bacterium]|nr:DUF1287 domain-containing protein [Alphaproteobacteria bacterium]
MTPSRRLVITGLGAAPWAAAALASPSRTAAIVAAARSQIGVTLLYDARYVRLAYPGGDVPLDRGVCTDVVVRALRVVGLDLQRAVHEDMRRAFSAYPRAWSARAPDPSIDHRRVPNLMTFFARHHRALPPGADVEPADILAWRLPGGAHHIGLASDRRIDARPLVIHNIGNGTREEDILEVFDRVGHYRLKPASG